MSRIGKMPITVPAGVDVKIDGHTVTAKGPKGELTGTFSDIIVIEQDGAVINVTRSSDAPAARSLHGLTRTLVDNMVQGVATGFSKKLEVVGVGYRAQVLPEGLELTVGYSHKVVMPAPETITVECPNANTIVISGPDKVKVGQFASEVRGVRPPEPYHGKGIRYSDEVIHLKEGKAGKAK
ncbi:MAG: 50S ribosomal protein L6 [Clostridia bacterium]|nr:50S ribosomal protein L6 [Clostridia bacterium]